MSKNTINVIKRNGEKEPLNYEKINKVLIWATNGISGVNASEVAMNAKIQMYDGITTNEIHKVIIKSASELISEDSPNYQYVAAKLVNYLLRKDVYNTYDNLPRFKDLIKSNIENKVYDSNISKMFDEREIDKLESYIKHERDNEFTYAGIQQLIDKYLIRDRKTNVFHETPQFMYMIISMVIYGDMEDKETRRKKIKECYDLLSTQVISLPTPILAGLRTVNKQYSSCFPSGQEVIGADEIINIEDIIEGKNVITHKDKMNKVVAKSKKLYSGNIVSIDTEATMNGKFKSTEDHLIYGFTKEQIKCIRSTGVCLTKQGEDKNCFKKENEYSNNCDYLKTNYEPKWIEAKNFKVNDFVKVSYYNEIEDITSFYVSDYIDLPNKYVVKDGKILKLNNKEDKRNGDVNIHVNSINNKIELNSDFFRLLGYFLAEGSSCQKNGYVQLTFNINENEYINDSVELFEKVWGITAFINKNHSDNSAKVFVSSKILPIIFENLFDKGFGNKKIPKLMMSVNPIIQKDLLIGIFRGDGYNTNQGLAITLKNKLLIYQIFQIALRNKFYPTMDTYKSKLRGNLYSMYLSKTKNYDFIVEVGKDLYKCVKSKKDIYSNSFWYNDSFFTKIKKINNDYVRDETVYDIQVLNDNSFNVNNVSVHNCVLIDIADDLDSIGASNHAILRYISNKAGIGLNPRLRGIGASVNNGEKIHTGIIPFLKMFEASVKSCSQGGIRGGAATAYYPFWHYEIDEIVSLKNNKGNDLNRARRLDHGIQLCKLFYERFINDEYITLFQLNEVPDLYDAFGYDNEKFEELYMKYENSSKKTKKKIKARDLMSHIATERIETGRIYIQNIDNANNHSSFLEAIRMSNLCTEITLVTSPFYDINSDEGEIALCVLGAINLGKIKILDELEFICDHIVYMLNKVIDDQRYIVKAAEKMLKRRSIGVGVTNFAYWLAKNNLDYGKDSLEKIDELFESVQYYLLKASMEQAKKYGKCEWFNKTKYSQGLLPIDHYNKNVDTLVNRKLTHDWENLRENILEYGLRNSTLTAGMPCESCVSKETKIQLADDRTLSYQEIFEEQGIDINFIEEQGIPNWYDFETPFKVKTKDGIDICNKFYYNGEKEVYEIEFEDGNIYKMTGNHKLLVDRNNKNVWCRVDSLQDGDNIINI